MSLVKSLPKSAKTATIKDIKLKTIFPGVALVVVLLVSLIVLTVDVLNYSEKTIIQNLSFKRSSSKRTDWENIYNPLVTISKEHISSLEVVQAGGACNFQDNKCTITCQEGELDDVIVQINEMIDGSTRQCEPITKLSFSSISFQSNTLTTGWLKDLAYNIQELSILNTDLSVLGDNAFSGPPFSQRKTSLKVSISGTNVRRITKNIFADGPIEIFELTCNSRESLLNLEEGAFDVIAKSLLNLQISNCLDTSEAVKNATGASSMSMALESLDLRYNMITSLEPNSFINCPNLQALYLSSNGLINIDLNAFTGLRKILQLDLSGNSLRTLPKGLFDDLDLCTKLNVAENPWNCDCDLQWLKNYMFSLNNMLMMCKVDYNYINFMNVEFCPGNSTTTTTTLAPSSSTKKSSSATTATAAPTAPSIETTSETTTKDSTPTDSTDSTPTDSTTTETTTPFNQNDEFIYEKILCRDISAYPYPKSTENEKSFLEEASFKRRNINYTIYESDQVNTFIATLEGYLKITDYVIWANVENRMDYGCLFNITRDVYMELQFDKTYTICLASNDTTDTYALIADDCTAVTTPLEWGERTWISNNQRICVILSITFGVLFTALVAGATVYYVIQHYPELIKGNKRVIIVKSGSYSPNVLVMPNNFENKERLQSIYTNPEGYLTPKLNHWSKSKLTNLKYQGLSTIMDGNSIDVDEKCQQNDLEECIYEPPPLPPNHPSERRNSARPYFHSNM